MTIEPPTLYVTRWVRAQPDGVLAGFSDLDEALNRMVYRLVLPSILYGSGNRAVVFRHAPPSGSMGGGALLATVSAICYADHTRDTSGIARIEDGLDRAWASWGKLDQLLRSADPAQTSPLIQITRDSPPLEFYDNDQNLPYIASNYGVAVVQTP